MELRLILHIGKKYWFFKMAMLLLSDSSFSLKDREKHKILLVWDIPSEDMTVIGFEEKTQIKCSDKVENIFFVST